MRQPHNVRTSLGLLSLFSGSKSSSRGCTTAASASSCNVKGLRDAINQLKMAKASWWYSSSIFARMRSYVSSRVVGSSKIAFRTAFGRRHDPSRSSWQTVSRNLLCVSTAMLVTMRSHLHSPSAKSDSYFNFSFHRFIEIVEAIVHPPNMI